MRDKFIFCTRPSHVLHAVVQVLRLQDTTVNHQTKWMLVTRGFSAAGAHIQY